MLEMSNVYPKYHKYQKIQNLLGGGGRQGDGINMQDLLSDGTYSDTV